MVGSSSSPFYILRPRALRVLRALGAQHLFLSSLVLLPQAPLDHTTRAIMAINHTSSNTTLPGEPGMIGWVPPDSRRSTLDIILSCLSIFLVCSWKCVHLNIPSYEESHARWHTIDLWEIPIFPKTPRLRKIGRQVMWMCIVSIAPELGVAVAVKRWGVEQPSLCRFARKAHSGFILPVRGDPSRRHDQEEQDFAAPCRILWECGHRLGLD